MFLHEADEIIRRGGKDGNFNGFLNMLARQGGRERDRTERGHGKKTKMLGVSSDARSESARLQIYWHLS